LESHLSLSRTGQRRKVGSIKNAPREINSNNFVISIVIFSYGGVEEYCWREQ